MTGSRFLRRQLRSHSVNERSHEISMLYTVF